MSTRSGKSHLVFYTTHAYGLAERTPNNWLLLDSSTALSTVEYHQALGTVKNVIDLSGDLSKTGIIDVCRHLGIPAVGPGLRGNALETVRTVGCREAERVCDVPMYSVITKTPDADTVRRLYNDLNDAGRIVVKSDTDTDRLTRVRIFSSIMEFSNALQTYSGFPAIVQRYVPGIPITVLAYVPVLPEDVRFGAKLSDIVVPVATAFDFKYSASGNLGVPSDSMGAVVHFGVTERLSAVCAKFAPMLLDRLYSGIIEFEFRYVPETDELFFIGFGTTDNSVAWQTVFESQPDLAFTPGDYREPSGQWAVAVVVAAAGYPHPAGLFLGKTVSFNGKPDVILFDVDDDEDETEFVTTGGRPVIAYGTHDTLVGARLQAYAAARDVHFFGKQYRDDIDVSPITEARLTKAGLLHAR